MVTSDGSAKKKKKGRPWRSKNRNRSKKAAKKRKRKSSHTNKIFAHKKGLSGIISSATKTSYRKADLVSRRKCIIKKAPCLHLTAEMRKILHRSPSDARAYIVKALPEAYIPCLRTFYNHIYSGDMGVYYGETPYHPGRRRKPRHPPHPAKTVPGRRSIADRPSAALARLEIGHWEMDTIVSGRSGKGGLLVLVDRCSRKYLIEHINYISQDEVLAALRKMHRRNAFEIVRSVTTYNGCEFLDQKRLDRFFKAKTYYTRAYAAWEKGSVENANRILRRFYPKGTNFNLLTRGQILQLENFINSIHRQSLDGETANDYHSRLAQAV